MCVESGVEPGRSDGVMELSGGSCHKMLAKIRIVVCCNIVVLEAKDQEAAAEFMNSDPTVVAGLVIMELHPFTLAFERKNP
jgi:uncharacterized protein YciI